MSDTQGRLNRLAGITDWRKFVGVQEAANLIAGTQGLATQEALNIATGRTDWRTYVSEYKALVELLDGATPPGGGGDTGGEPIDGLRWFINGAGPVSSLSLTVGETFTWQLMDGRSGAWVNITNQGGYYPTPVLSGYSWPGGDFMTGQSTAFAAGSGELATNYPGVTPLPITVV